MSEIKMLIEFSGWDEANEFCVWVFRTDQIQGFKTHEYWIVIYLVGGLQVKLEYKNAEEYRETLTRLEKVIEDICYLSKLEDMEKWNEDNRPL